MTLLALIATASSPPTEPDPTLDTYAPVATTPRYSRAATMAADVDRTWQAPLTITAPVRELELVYSSTHGGDTATIAAAIEHNGDVYPATFDGQPRATITGTGATQWATGAVTLPTTLQPGTEIRVRTFATAGSRVMTGAIGQSGPRQYADGDHTATGSGPIPINTGILTARVTPVAILGATTAGTISVAGLGDSIMEGGNDSNYEASPPGGGFFTRAARATAIPATCFGLWADNFPGPTDRRFGGLLAHFTHAVCEYGTNALGGAVVTGGGWQYIANAGLTFWTWVASQGVTLAQTTLTPKTGSTDGFATIEGQSVATDGTEQVRLAFNAWVRDSCPIVDGAPVAPGATGALRAGDVGHPLAAVIDTDAACRASKANGDQVWDAGLCSGTDGTHPNGNGHARMAGPVADWINSQK